MEYDLTRRRGWLPPHCPNANCRYHERITAGWRYKKIGFSRRRLSPHRIQRYRCRHCGVTFSSQTFSTSYDLKRPDVLPRLLPLLVSGAALRPISRLLGTSVQTVTRQTARLGRHCLLHHALLLEQYRPTGAVVIDGFESFELSQYHPFQHHLAVEAETSLLVYFTDSELRRKGRMTDRQKRRRRDRGNPLFEVNLHDLMLRHCSANHRRETIAWSKRRQGSAERLAVYLVWANEMKPRRLKRGGASAAMRKGWRDRLLTVGELLRQRLFRTRQWLPPRWAAYYERRIETRALRGTNRRHELKYAF